MSASAADGTRALDGVLLDGEVPSGPGDRLDGLYEGATDPPVVYLDIRSDEWVAILAILVASVTQLSWWIWTLRERIGRTAPARGPAV